jgi:GAF domain-containing protein
MPTVGSAGVDLPRHKGRRAPRPRLRHAVVTAAEFQRAVRAQVSDGEHPALSLAQLCVVCEEMTSLPTSIVLSSAGQSPAAVAASDGAAIIEQLQLSLGEGPGVDAYAEGRPVLIEDLAGAARRWMLFVPAARDLGVRAVFAFPLQLGAVRIGVMSLYAGRSNPPVDGKLADMTTLAELVTDAVLAMQSGAGADELSWALSNAAEHRAVVHQATGMLIMQLECAAQDALARLRAKAFADGVGVDEVSRLVVERQLRFDR